MNAFLRLLPALILISLLPATSLKATADDTCPTVSIVGSPPAPCHVTPSDPGMDNGTVVAYTVEGTATGTHADGTLRKITEPVNRT